MKQLCRNLSTLSLCGLLALTLTGCPGDKPPTPTVAPKDDAARLAAIQQQQQFQADQAKHNAELNKKVEANKKKSNSFNTGGSKVWQTYVP
jgi:hypothetical protein